MNPETLQKLDEWFATIGEKLGAGVEFSWPRYVSVVWWEALIGLSVCLGTLLAGAIFVTRRRGQPFFAEEMPSPRLWLVATGGALLFVGLICTLDSRSCGLASCLVALFEPEGYAIRELLRGMR